MTTPELPPLPPLGRFSQDFHRMRVMQDGAWCPYDDVKAIDDAREARERILVAEIERLRAECEAMRADAERYRWLASKARKDTAYDRYGDGAAWSIGFFADDSRHTRGAATDAAREDKP